VYHRWFFAFLAAALALSPPGALAQQTGARPSIAVLDFNTNGLTSNWYGAFQPGVALSDLVTDQMVNSGRFNVLDRTHLSSTLGEHQLAASGEVDRAISSPETSSSSTRPARAEQTPAASCRGRTRRPPEASTRTA
jgi:curli biogenesis system outer membrane secretion channel CsgG